MEIERDLTRQHDVGNSLRKRLWSCLKTDYGMLNEDTISIFMV